MKKRALVIGGIATAAVLAASWALAQPAGFGHGGMGPGGMGPGSMGLGGTGPGGMGASGFGPGHMMGGHGAMAHGVQGQGGPGAFRGGPGIAQVGPARLDALKTELGITAAQESAWTKYAKAIQDAAAAMKTARESVSRGSAGPQERFAFATKMREQGQKQFETVKTAANELLSTLTDAQKTKAQQTLPGLAFGPGAMHGSFAGGPPFRQ